MNLSIRFFLLLLVSACTSAPIQNTTQNEVSSAANMINSDANARRVAGDAESSNNINVTAANSSSPSTTLPFCEIVNNPEKYTGKAVRIKANLYWFTHGFYLRDKNCSTEFPEKPSQPDWNYYDRTVGVSFDESRRDAIWAILDKHPLRIEDDDSHRKIIATGQFFYRTPCADGFCSDHILDRVFFEFQISELHSIKAK